jgi:prevent-host-death family protein
MVGSPLGKGGSTMRRLGIRELKARMSEIIRDVQEGETIEITNHDQVVALLVPAQREVDQAQVKAALARLDALAAEIAEHVTEPTDVAQMLSDMRR